MELISGHSSDHQVFLFIIIKIKLWNVNKATALGGISSSNSRKRSSGSETSHVAWLWKLEFLYRKRLPNRRAFHTFRDYWTVSSSVLCCQLQQLACSSWPTQHIHRPCGRLNRLTWFVICFSWTLSTCSSSLLFWLTVRDPLRRSTLNLLLAEEGSNNKTSRARRGSQNMINTEEVMTAETPQ